MKLLITGGCGYVGTELIKSLLKKNYKIINVDNQWFGNFLPKHKNLKNLKLDIRQIEKINFIGIDAIVHLAGVANDPSAELNEKLSWDINVLATKFLIEKAIKFKVKKFIFASSGSVYGIKKETEVTEDLTLKPISIYNKTKMIAENVLMSYKDQIQVFCIRPATVCGYSDRMRFDVSVNMLTYQALAKKQITVFGGNQIRPNIHIKDMIRVYDFLISKELPSGCYNAGFENISILNLAKIISERFNKVKIKIIKNTNAPRSYRLCADKIISYGFNPMYKVNNAIDELIENFSSRKYSEHENFYNVKWMKKIRSKIWEEKSIY
jgi:nucleoside-diphosphate-sugar epimerase